VSRPAGCGGNYPFAAVHNFAAWDEGCNDGARPFADDGPAKTSGRLLVLHRSNTLPKVHLQLVESTTGAVTTGRRGVGVRGLLRTQLPTHLEDRLSF
jgi:hypothetical protein